MAQVPLMVGAMAPFGRLAIARQAEHEADEVEARALGIEVEAKALWRRRCEEARGSLHLRPPRLRDCTLEILWKAAWS